MILLMIPMVIPTIIPMIPVDLVLRVVIFLRASLMAVIRLAVVRLIDSERPCSTCCLIIPSTPKCSVSIRTGWFGFCPPSYPKTT